MFRICVLVPTLSIFLLSTHGTFAATNKWKSALPGANAGEIVIEGTFTPDACWTIDKQCQAVAWPLNKDGSIGEGAVSVTINTMTGAWSKTLTGLTSGQDYWIVVQSIQNMAMISATFCTEVRVAKAK